VALILITVASLIVAAAMSVVAWRIVREERRRSDARVAVLAADIHGERLAPVHVSDSFFAEDRSRTPASPLRALAIGVAVVSSIVALVVFASASPRHPVAHAASPPATTPAKPLELMSLHHERDHDRLIVRGSIRQATAAPFADLTAVVSVYDRRGDLAASGEGLVTGAQPVAGGVESSFVVTVPGASDVARYRVAFKSNERIIAHVDRRDHGVTAELP
jgi:hypothetical protein